MVAHQNGLTGRDAFQRGIRAMVGLFAGLVFGLGSLGVTLGSIRRPFVFEGHLFLDGRFALGFDALSKVDGWVFPKAKGIAARISGFPSQFVEQISEWL